MHVRKQTHSNCIYNIHIVYVTVAAASVGQIKKNNKNYKSAFFSITKIISFIFFSDCKQKKTWPSLLTDFDTGVSPPNFNYRFSTFLYIYLRRNLYEFRYPSFKFLLKIYFKVVL